MDLIGLVSGGKDSIYALLEAVRLGHRIACVANLYPAGAADADAGADAHVEYDSDPAADTGAGKGA